MGRLLYGDSGRAIAFDDRTLIHLHLVINAKLRRREGFFFTWKDDPSAGSGRSSVWLESSIPLCFTFSSNARHPINREWLELLTISANQPQGMQLLPEPPAAPPPPVAQSATAGTAAASAPRSGSAQAVPRARG